MAKDRSDLDQTFNPAVFDPPRIVAPTAAEEQRPAKSNKTDYLLLVGVILFFILFGWGVWSALTYFSPHPFEKPLVNVTPPPIRTTPPAKPMTADELELILATGMRLPNDKSKWDPFWQFQIGKHLLFNGFEKEGYALMTEARTRAPFKEWDEYQKRIDFALNELHEQKK